MLIRNNFLKTLVIMISVLMTALHIVKAVFSGFEINQLSIIVFVLLSISVFKENRFLYSYAFMVQSIITILTMTGDPNLSPVLFLFFAMLYNSSIVNLSTISIILPVSFILKSYLFHPWTESQVIEVILCSYALLSAIYVAVIKLPPDIDFLSKTTPLSVRQLLILKYLYKGVLRKNMPAFVREFQLWRYGIKNFTFDIINSEIKSIKDLLGLKTEFELGAWYESHVKNNRFITKY